MQEHLRLHFDTQDASDEQVRVCVMGWACQPAQQWWWVWICGAGRWLDTQGCREHPLTPPPPRSTHPSRPQVLSIFPTTIRRRILQFLYMKHLRSCYLFRKCPQVLGGGAAGREGDVSG